MVTSIRKIPKILRTGKPKLLKPPTSMWFNSHTHSKYSKIDGMTHVEDLVRKAHLLGQPAMGLTDHGNLAGITEGYLEASKLGMKFFPGIETYLLDPSADDPMHAKTGRFHVCLLARTYKGYQGLVKLSSLAFTRPRFSNFPRLTLGDLKTFADDYGDDVILMTGCYFGLAQQQLVKEGIDAATRVVETYASWFPHTFVEIQSHNIAHEDDGEFATDTDINNALIDIAHFAGLPVMATQDCHYTDQVQKEAHALMKRMVYRGDEYSEFPGDSFHLASSDWVAEHYDEGTWHLAEEGAAHMLSLHDVKIPALDKYKPHVPHMADDPDRVLGKMVREKLVKFLHDRDMSRAKSKRYSDRLEEELSVIKYVGQANYFLLWRKFVLWCRKQKIAIEARGSANGSLVAFLLEITQSDPIQWNTLFERFMSRDRKKPPDIDMDIESDRRAEAIQWFKDNFAEAIQIGAWSALGSTEDDEGNAKGSVLVSYKSYLRSKSEKLAQEYFDKKGITVTKAALADYAKRIFFKRFGHVESIEDIYDLSERDYWGLREMSDMDSVIKSNGVHAAGVLLGSDEVSLAENIPTMLVASSDTMTTQFDMDALDYWGLMKVDILGQVTLTVMKRTQEMIGRADATDFSWIPKDDRAACKILREGRLNNGIFHFEGYTKARGGKEMGIANTKDAIFASALYMPGAMNSGQKDHYLKHRRNAELNRKQQYPHEVFRQVLSETYGAVVFQEQPIEILRGLGMSMENVNKLFKVVKDSGKGAVERNKVLMEELRKEFEYLCVKNGIEDVDWAWHLCTGFIEYGFNRAHATGYGIRSYRCAYLKAHYPAEFMAALLEVWALRGKSGKLDKEKEYMREARRLEIRLLPPHVNVSGPSWTLDNSNRRAAIRRGLASVKGMGYGSAVEIAAKAPYASITDMVQRVSGRALTGGAAWTKEGVISGKLKALSEAGALDGLEP